MERPNLTKDHFDRLKHALRSPIRESPIEAVDTELVLEFAPLVYWICKKYFRLEIEGLTNVPTGKALIVGNHNSGVSFYEAMGVAAYWYMQRGPNEVLHALAHDAIMNIPYINNFLARVGTLRASHDSAREAFLRNRKVLVFPGGNLEAFRPYRQRNRIVFGNRKGFIKLAIREQVPIVPAIFLGGHEGFFVLNDGQFISKLFGLKKIPILRSDTWPLMLAFPWGLAMGPVAHFPLPTKCRTRFLEPIPVSNYLPQDQNNPVALQEVYDRVVNTMQQALTEMASERQFPLLG